MSRQYYSRQNLVSQTDTLGSRSKPWSRGPRRRVESVEGGCQRALVTSSLPGQLLDSASRDVGQSIARPDLLHNATRDLVVAQFKDKDLTLAKFRDMAMVLGRACLTAVLEELAAPVLAALLVKLDKANKGLAGEGKATISHLLALGFGEIEPSPSAKVGKSPKPKAAGAKEPVRLLHQSKALGRKT